MRLVCRNSEGAACIESLHARVVEITHQNKFATETDSDLHCNRVTVSGEARARWGLEVVMKSTLVFTGCNPGRDKSLLAMAYRRATVTPRWSFPGLSPVPKVISLR